ncbi:MAG: response regulator transcription factor [Desulfobacterales bacterium]|jgi:DNA-binding NarL/FixJ family response regulator
MGETKKIIIAEDHRLFREGIKALLESNPEYEIVCEAGDGLEAIRCAQEHKADLMILDLSMPRLGGISALRDIKRQSPEIKILVLTIHQSEQYVLETFEAGAAGYCLKDAGRKELRMAIETVLAGNTYLSPGISEIVMEGYIEGRKKLKNKTTWDTITQREREVLKLLGEGYKNKEISDLLHISVKTVEKHRANIMSKLDLHNAAALTAYAIKKGLVTRKA